uniref:SAM domain-containing protein n=1 Tax=Ciona savignyi TaxID=51511 RepID=H2ZGN9_CIOSA
MSPLPQSSPMGDVPSPSTSPSSKVRMRRIVNVDDNNVAMGNSDGDKKTRAHGGARPQSAASTISGVSSHSDEGSVEKRGQTQGELYLSTPSWSVDDVVAWMSGCGLTLHVATFNQHKIDGAKLMAIDNDRLKEMGIVDKSEKNLLKRKVKELKTRYEKERKLADKLNKKQKKGFRTGKKPLF